MAFTRTLEEVNLSVLSIVLILGAKLDLPPLLRGVELTLSAAVLLRRPVPEKPALFIPCDDHHLVAWKFLRGLVVELRGLLVANGGGFGGAGCGG